MKLKQIIAALLIAHVALPAYSQENANLGDQVLDLGIYRPLGLFGTLLGTCAFAAISPTAAIATLVPPHDAILRAGEALVLEPAEFTFSRPLGEPLFKSHHAKTER